MIVFASKMTRYPGAPELEFQCQLELTGIWNKLTGIEAGGSDPGAQCLEDRRAARAARARGPGIESPLLDFDLLRAGLELTASCTGTGSARC